MLLVDECVTSFTISDFARTLTSNGNGTDHAWGGNALVVGGGVKGSLSLLEMTKICEEITGNKIVISPVLQDREADIRIYVTDNSKLYEKSSWRPIKTNRELFEDIFMWIKNNENQLKGILN